VLFRQSEQHLAELPGVGGVIDFKSVHPLPAEFGNHFGKISPRFLQLLRVGKDRNSACLVEERNRLGGRINKAGYIGRSSLAQIFIKGRIHIIYDTLADQQLGDVRPAALSLAGDLLQFIKPNIDALPVQDIEDLMVPFQPAVLQALQCPEKLRLLVIEQIAEKMQG